MLQPGSISSWMKRPSIARAPSSECGGLPSASARLLSMGRKWRVFPSIFLHYMLIYVNYVRLKIIWFSFCNRCFFFWGGHMFQCPFVETPTEGCLVPIGTWTLSWRILLTYWCLVGNGWEWGNETIIFIVIVDHSIFFPIWSSCKLNIETSQHFGGSTRWVPRVPSFRLSSRKHVAGDPEATIRIEDF